MANSQPTFFQAAEELSFTRGYSAIVFTAPGAFKETYRAETPNGNQVAVKILNPAKCSVARVDREIEAMKRCNSPHIAKLYENGEFTASDGNNYLFVIEEFLDGGTLADKLKASLEIHIVRNYAVCLCEALEYLATLNLVHRDIKPDNIMFRSGSDKPILVDFGLVRDLSASSLTMDWLPHGPGTPYYSPPEQLNNEKPLIKWRSDQFSLGIVMGICLTGKHAFSGAGMTMPEIVNAVAARQKCTADFCNEVQALGFGNIPKMIEPWPINRYSTPAELLQSFRP